MLQISHTGQAEQTINKSRFVAVAQYCADERAVAAMLRGLAAQHGHAHHLAFAFRLKQQQGVIQRCNDAGEPSGTAGMPILQHLEGRDMVNTCIAVIRYYGGINLGTGGLARAYGGTAKMALDAATLAPYVEMQLLKLVLDYNRLDSFTRDLGKLGGGIIDKQFAEKVSIVASAPVAEIPGLLGRYQN